METLPRLDLASPNLAEEAKAALRDLFPEAFDETGKLDFARLKELLGEFADGDRSRYGLSWAGKQDAKRALLSQSVGTLAPMREESVEFDQTENLIIEGDNLEVLKLLQKAYYGKVKMIYIDPPYNTGNDFIYPDNFREGLTDYLKYSGQVSEEGFRTSSNTETSGRYHSNWLNMMYPRLALARNLLREDGVIFVSIDDHEVHNLRMLMDEVFGEENFIACICWEGALKNDSRFISESHDYIVSYTRNRLHLQVNQTIWRTQKEGIEAIYRKAEELKRRFGTNYEAASTALSEWYTSLNKNEPAWQHRHYRRIDGRGVYFPGDISWPGGGGPTYEVIHPITRRPVAVPAGGWRYSKLETMAEKIADGRIEFGADESKVPTVKRYLHETEGQVLPSVIYKDRRAAMQRLRELFGGVEVFDNPKDEQVILKHVEAVTSGSDIVLDFFAGSGTTAQAVMELNQEDGGNRRFILVQLPEPLDKPIKLDDGTKLTTIADICRERVRRAAKKIAAKTEGKLDLEASKPDLGFRAFKLTSSNFKLWEDTTEGDTEKLKEQLKLYAENILPDRDPEWVLYEILLKSGIELSAPVESIEVDGEPVFKIAAGRLLAYLNDPVDESALRKLIEMDFPDLEPGEKRHIVCLDHGFRGNDALKANIAQQVKQWNSHHPEKPVEFRTV